MVNINEIAKYLENKLNGEYKFKIAGDKQLYIDKWLKVNGADFTPGVVRLLLNAPPVNNFGTYATVYRLEMQCDQNIKQELEDFLIGFIRGNHGIPDSIDDFNFIGAYRQPTFSDFGKKGDGSNASICKITLDFELWVMLAGVVGSGVKIYIDDVLVPYVEKRHVKNMGIVPNMPNNTQGLPEFTGDSYEISIPIVNNSKVLQLLEECKSSSANIKHTIKTVYAPWYEVVQDYYLQSMTIRSVSGTGGVSAAFSFTKTFPRKDFQIKIAGEDYKTIPLLSYSYAVSANHNTVVKNGYETVFGELQNYPIQTGYSIEVVFSLRELVEQLPAMYEYIKTNNSNAVYQIKDGDKEYDVVIKNASEAYEENPGIALRVAFIEVGNG